MVPLVDSYKARACRYKPSQLHSLVSDIESYPRFLPFCTGARILSRTPASVNETETFQAEMTVGFLTFKESYVSDVKSRPNEYVEVSDLSEPWPCRNIHAV